MRKSLYSLILFDDVVDAVDRMAYEKNMNRSQLINEILARQVGLLTPEQRVNKIISKIIEMVNKEESLQVKVQSDSGNLQFGTFLRYKYKPSIKYAFDFYTKDNERYAMLKVVSRTKSPELCAHLRNFFSILAKIDRNRFNELHSKEVITCIPDDSNNRFSREFLSGISIEGIRDEEIAEYLTRYLVMLDESLKYYFSHIDNLQNAAKQIDGIYLKHMSDIRLYRL